MMPQSTTSEQPQVPPLPTTEPAPPLHSDTETEAETENEEEQEEEEEEQGNEKVEASLVDHWLFRMKLAFHVFWHSDTMKYADEIVGSFITVGIGMLAALGGAAAGCLKFFRAFRRGAGLRDFVLCT